MILSSKMAPWLAAVVALDGCLAGPRLVATWLATWQADQPAGLLAASLLTPILPCCPAGLLAGQPADPRWGPLTGFLLTACLSGLPSLSLCICSFPGSLFF